MAISITAIDRHNGATCEHIAVTVNDEGVSRTFETTFTEVDRLFEELSVLDQKKLLVMLWARYRRATGRQVIGVNIA